MFWLLLPIDSVNGTVGKLMGPKPAKPPKVAVVILKPPVPAKFTLVLSTAVIKVLFCNARGLPIVTVVLPVCKIENGPVNVLAPANVKPLLLPLLYVTAVCPVPSVIVPAKVVLAANWAIVKVAVPTPLFVMVPKAPWMHYLAVGPVQIEHAKRGIEGNRSVHLVRIRGAEPVL